jgi:hypothetical protein
VNSDSPHTDVIPVEGLVNPAFGESSVCSVPMTPQLAAEAIDGTNAHTAIARAKSNTLFEENFFISICSL